MSSFATLINVSFIRNGVGVTSLLRAGLTLFTGLFAGFEKVFWLVFGPLRILWTTVIRDFDDSLEGAFKFEFTARSVFTGWTEYYGCVFQSAVIQFPFEEATWFCDIMAIEFCVGSVW